MMRNNRRGAVVTILVAAMLGSAGCVMDDGELLDDDSVGSSSQAVTYGILEQGIRLQGVRLQGVRLQGVRLQGMSLDGVTLDGSALVADGYSVSDMEGATFWTELDDVSTKIKIANIYTDSKYSDVYIYELQKRVKYYYWKYVCGSSGCYFSKRSAYRYDPLCSAIPIDGEYDGYGNLQDTGNVTFSCLSGVAAKCVRWGYRPWKSITRRVYYWGRWYYYTTTLRSHHQACTRMAMADYLSDANSFTQDGNLVDVEDPNGIQRFYGYTYAYDANGYKRGPRKFEGVWDQYGPVCINTLRMAAYDELASGCSYGDLRCVMGYLSAKGFSTPLYDALADGDAGRCRDDATARANYPNALIFNATYNQ